MDEFEAIGRLDYRAPEAEADPGLSLARLFPGGHGNMFGVLDCRNDRGETVVLRAFSSLPRGIRDIAGWVPPNLTEEVYYGTVVPTRAKIESMTAELGALASADPAHADLLAERKRTSQELIRTLYGSYRFSNFRGEERGLKDAVWPPGPVVGGVGECCAPKLLNHAARNGLEPLGLAEFYWGDSKSHVAGEFYPSCIERCQPIVGFMLCGLES